MAGKSQSRSEAFCEENISVYLPDDITLAKKNVNRYRFITPKISREDLYSLLLRLIISRCGSSNGSRILEASTEVHLARARYLLKDRLLQITFGIYLVEFSINDHLANSFYSIDKGLNYKKCLQIELRGSHKDYLDALVELIDKTESLLITKKCWH